MKIKVLLILWSILVIAAQCGEPIVRPVKIVESKDNETLHRIMDNEAGVVCWYFGETASEISCLPISQTKLQR